MSAGRWQVWRMPTTATHPWVAYSRRTGFWERIAENCRSKPTFWRQFRSWSEAYTYADKQARQ